jgi:hypothetical protein
MVETNQWVLTKDIATTPSFYPKTPVRHLFSKNLRKMKSRATFTPNAELAAPVPLENVAAAEDVQPLLDERSA